MFRQISHSEILQVALKVTVASVVTYYSLKWMMAQLDPTSKNKKKARTKAEEQIKRLGLQSSIKLDTNSLSEHELVIAAHLVVPEDIKEDWKSIAGLDSVIQELRESVVHPIRHRNLLSGSQLWQAPKGVLLHGPPGCGKTLIAKATAKDAGMQFINLDIAMLTDKWYGESQKLASAVFTLAEKLQPCIVFIDEIESLLRSRNSLDHEATAMMKTLFMQHWDGLSTKNGCTVIIMGATNRPQDLDRAILRRMPAQFHIGLPNPEQRARILRLVLQTETLANDVDVNRVSELTKGFSGSDLRELCRNASVYRVRDLLRELSAQNANEQTEQKTIAPPICQQDLLDSLRKMKESKSHTRELASIDVD